jgi:hypothetical protein
MRYVFSLILRICIYYPDLQMYLKKPFIKVSHEYFDYNSALKCAVMILSLIMRIFIITIALLLFPLLIRQFL